MTQSSPDIYFDDVVVGEELRSSAVRIERADIIAFAQQWDPLPIHLDENAAIAQGFAGVTASGTHLLAIKHRLLYDFNLQRTVLFSFGYDEVRFHAPGLVGDLLHVRLRWIEKRLSNSRPGTGIAKHHCELTREDGTVLLSLYDTVLVRCRD